MIYLITGTAGFIGFHLARQLLETGVHVIGIDCYNDYYDVSLKHARNDILNQYENFQEYKHDLSDAKNIIDVFDHHRPDIIFHLAAQAGVRYSLENPQAYITSNIDATLSLLEAARAFPPYHMVLASSSSVYGASQDIPFHEDAITDHPLSLYAATKKSNEMMVHCYSHLYNIPCTMARFFTVYGPWGRPDMALFLFTQAMLNREAINIFNHGKMIRDFTYIDDIITSLILLGQKPATCDNSWQANAPNTATSGVAPYRIVNIGNSTPVALMTYIEAIAEKLDIKPTYHMMDMQAGDVAMTHADCLKLQKITEFQPQTSIRDGVDKFIDWYKDFYKK